MTVAGRLEPGVVGVSVDFLFERIQDAQPRISGESRAWNRHMKFFALAAAGAALVLIQLSVTRPPARRFWRDGVLQYSFTCQHRSLIHELARVKIQLASTERHASTKYFCLWKSFREIFRVPFNFNREEKFLSSAELITATRVVQKRDDHAGPRQFCGSE